MREDFWDLKSIDRATAHADTQSLTLQLRNAAKAETNADIKNVLQLAADKLGRVVADFALLPTAGNLRDLNGLWSFGERVLAIATVPAPPAPLFPPIQEGARLAA